MVHVQKFEDKSILSSKCQESAYKTLYKVVMNINEQSHQPYIRLGLDGDRCIKRDTPTLMEMEKVREGTEGTYFS